MTSELARWARARGTPLRLPEDIAPEGDIHQNPCVDFGGLIRRVPGLVLVPRHLDELAACVAMARALGLRWRARGAGHSSGGQPLLEGGVILDLRHLNRIVEDDGASLTVEAGIWWLEVFRHLARTGRRPAVLTDNLRSSVGGTLAVGGVGGESHLEGMQADGVLALTVVTPDGTIQRVGPHDDLFRFTLAGHGQLGVIAEARLQVRERPPFLAARGLIYPTLRHYLAVAREAAETGRYTYVRGRMLWRRHLEETPVRAVVGTFSDDPGRAPPAHLGGAVKATAPEILDLVARASQRRSTWPRYCPCAELALPLPDGLSTWTLLDRALRAFGLPDLLPDGSSVMVLAPGARLPLGLVSPGVDAALVVALRPGIEDEAAARKVAAFLRALSARAVALGARLYGVGEEPDSPAWFAHHYGPVLPAWRSLKTQLDPEGLCHPWHLR